MISFAKRMASEIAFTVAGIRGVLEYCASLRDARIAAAISRTRLRPSSTEAWYIFRLLFVYKLEFVGSCRMKGCATAAIPAVAARAPSRAVRPPRLDLRAQT